MKEKIAAAIEGIDEKQRIYIFWGVLLLIFVIDYFVLMGPQIRTFTKINPKINVLNKDLKETNNNLTRVGQYRQDIQKIEKDVEKANLSVTPRAEVPLILEQVSRLASKNGIVIDHLDPMAIDEELLLESDDRDYYDIPINIDAQGSYHDFGKFVNDIENDEIYMRIFSFSIDAGATNKEHRLNLKIKAIIYEDSDGKNKNEEKK